jgi:hypothetical protein
MNNAKGGTMNGHPIGTRVRIVRTISGKRTGATGTVISAPREAPSLINGVIAARQHVRVDGHGAYLDGNPRHPFGYPPDWLEPIRDDWDTDATPNAVASWAGGVWTPERVRA